MTTTTLPPLSAATRDIASASKRLAWQRRAYTLVAIGLLVAAVVAASLFADDSNAGHFIDRLPHLFDFLSWLVPRDWNDVWRALFDLASPNAVPGEEFNFPKGRVDVWGAFYIPEYFYLMLTTINVALVATLVGFGLAVPLSFLAARNYAPFGWLRIITKRVMELLRAFPEIVFAGLFAAVLSIGPIAAIMAITLHCIGALGKLFYEVVENAEMGPDEGLTAVGGNWISRVRFAALPTVLPNFTSYGLLRFEINVRASTIIGAVGGGGIGEELKLSISRGFGAKTLALVLLIFLTILAVDQLSAWLRRRLVGDAGYAQQQ